MTAKKAKRRPLFQRLKQGLNEGIEFSKQKLELRSVEFPEEPPEIDAAELAALRQQSGLSQAVFARLLNVSTKTVQSWEQGTRKPSQASRRLIQVFSHQPKVLYEIAGLTGRQREGRFQLEPGRSGKRKKRKQKLQRTKVVG